MNYLQENIYQMLLPSNILNVKMKATCNLLATILMKLCDFLLKQAVKAPYDKFQLSLSGSRME